jgi:hypothetical protein
MIKSERGDINKLAKGTGFRESADGSRLINNYDGYLCLGSNRTVIDINSYYGAGNAEKCLNKSDHSVPKRPDTRFRPFFHTTKLI